MILEITTSIGCRVACAFCPQGLLVGAYGASGRMMTLETFKTCISKIPHNGGVHFSGYSEPFQNPACADMILWAASVHRRLSLYTTLVNATPDTVRKIAGVKFEHNCVHLADANGFAHIDVDRNYLDTLAVYDAAFPDASYMCMGDLPPQLKDICGGRVTYTAMHSRAGNLEGIAHRDHTGPIRCQCSPAMDHNVLLPDGRVALCCMDFGVRHVLGNLLTQNWQEICRGDVKRQLMQDLRDGRPALCRTCDNAEPI